VLLVNGIPLVVIEAKTPVRSSQSWLDGALQVHDDYEKNVPELFVPNVFSVATEGKEFRYGSIGMPVELWGPWRLDGEDAQPSLEQVEKAVVRCCARRGAGHARELHRLRDAQGQAAHQDHRRYQQVDGVNKIVERVVAGQPARG
jgi:type I restriction enzyme, R subunit